MINLDGVSEEVFRAVTGQRRSKYIDPFKDKNFIRELRDRWNRSRSLRFWGFICFELQYRRIKRDISELK